MREFVRFYAKPDPFTRAPELFSKVNRRLAEDLETKLRAHLQPGVDLRAGEQRTIRVAAEGNRLVIEPVNDKVSPESVGLNAETTDRRRGSEEVADLFAAGSGVPAVRRVSGQDRLVFRQINAQAAVDISKKQEESLVDAQMRQTLEFEFPRYLEQAVRELANENPEMRMREDLVV